jgi:hypothetical protein
MADLSGLLRAAGASGAIGKAIDSAFGAPRRGGGMDRSG